MRLRRSAVAVVALVAAPSLVACGSYQDDLPERTPSFVEGSALSILRAGLDDVDGMRSAHIVGTYVDDRGSFRLDLVLDREGTCFGKITPERGQPARVIVKGRLAYFRGGVDTIRALVRDLGLRGADARRAVAAIGDRWLVGEATSRAVRSCDLDEVLSGFEGLREDPVLRQPHDPAGLSTGQVQPIDGTRSIQLEGLDDRGTASVWIAVEEPHYPTHLTYGIEGESYSVSFSEFNRPVRPVLPRGDQVFDPAGVLTWPTGDGDAVLALGACRAQCL